MTRMSEEELAKILASDPDKQVIENKPAKRPPIPTSGKPKEAKKEKYGAQKCEYNGIIFDSKVERQVYRDELLPMKQAGEITDLEYHGPSLEYKLQPEFVLRGKKYRPIKIVPDFRFTEVSTGETVVVDVKGGKSTQTPVFKAKWKMLLYAHRNDLSIRFEVWERKLRR